MKTLIITIHKEPRDIDYSEMSINQRINYKGNTVRKMNKMGFVSDHIFERLKCFLKWGSFVAPLQRCERLF